MPYLASWSIREVKQLYLLGKETTIEKRGKIIAEEGTICNKVYAILEGEVEVIRTNMSKIFFNACTGVLAIAEDNQKASLIRSDISCE